MIGEIDPGGQILIAEGYATAASLHEATGLTVAVACDCVNLQPVGEALRKKYPAAMLILCADDDAWTAGNPGAAKAKDAAQAVGGKIALPKFCGPRMEGQTDFNDLARAEGLEVVRRAIEEALLGPVLAISNPKTIAKRIDELAELDAVSYGREKKAAAEALGIGAADLNKAVTDRRREIAAAKRAAAREARRTRIAAACDGSDNPYSDGDTGIYVTEMGYFGGKRMTRLANFKARIVSDAIYDDGVEANHIFEIEAHLRGRKHSFSVAATQFASLNWVASNLGAGAYVEAGLQVKDRVRVAIQRLSEDIAERHVYAHTGWRTIDGAWAYLHAGGAIGEHGVIENIEVSLHGRLAHYLLPEPPAGDALTGAIRGSLQPSRSRPRPRDVSVAGDHLPGAAWRFRLHHVSFGADRNAQERAGGAGAGPLGRILAWEEPAWELDLDGEQPRKHGLFGEGRDFCHRRFQSKGNGGAGRRLARKGRPRAARARQ